MLSFKVSSEHGYIFAVADYLSPRFQSEKECVLAILKYCLASTSLLINIHGLTPHMGRAIDLAFGKGFKLKFKFAEKPLEIFISFCTSQADDVADFNKKLLLLISPFYKIDYSGSHVITLKLPDKTNPKTENHFNSKVFFQSPDRNYTYRRGDTVFFCDASCKTHSSLAGAAIRDRHLICAFRKKIKLEDNNLAELKAIKETVLLAQSMGVCDLNLYTDNSSAIDLISREAKINTIGSEFLQVSIEINDLLKVFSSYRIAWIPRRKNFIADNLSKENFNGIFSF